MRQVDEPSDGVFATAVAAATYAINSFEEGSLSKKMPGDGLQTTSTKTKSRRENSSLKITDPGRISRWFRAEDPKEDKGSVGETSMRRSESRGGKALEDPRKGVVTVPSIKKSPTFADKYLNDTGSKRFASEKEKITGQNASASLGIPTSRASSGKLNSSSGHTDTKADAWEKAEMAKIQRRYEKTYSSIVEWENAKKGKAKCRFEQKEGGLALRRARAFQDYNDEISRIGDTASGARSVADERRRKEEIKTKEKANEIRSTGKIPRACPCF